MSSYRESAAPAPEELDFRPTTRHATLVQIVTGVLSLGYGTWMELAVRPTRPVPLASTILGQAVVGLAVLCGALLLWRAAAGWATHVRVRREGANLLLATYRWGRLVRSQQLALSSVERVFVEEKRGGRSTSYRLVIATASGPLTFEAAGLGKRAEYEKQAAELSAFLEHGSARTGGARVADATSNDEGHSPDASSEDDRAARHEKA